MAWPLGVGGVMKAIFKSLFFLMFLGPIGCFAGMMNACQAEGVLASCRLPLWTVGGHAMYVQATSAAFQQQSYQHDSLSTTSFETGANLPWAWGFALDAAYQYEEANSLTLNWYHLRTEAQVALAAPISYTNWVAVDPLTMAPVVFESFVIDNAQTVIKPAWDQVNAALAKTIHLGASAKLHLHGGVNYSHVAYTGKYFVEGAVQLKNEGAKSLNQLHGFSASYNGFGLRTGFQAIHDFENHFSLYADAAVSMLAGTQKSSQQIDTKLDARSYDGFYNNSQMRVVPEFDGRLGAAYDYQLVQGILSADISWLWVNYFNAFTSNAYDFGIQGLYFGLKWTGDFV
jgi:hypothetical protein